MSRIPVGAAEGCEGDPTDTLSFAAFGSSYRSWAHQLAATLGWNAPSGVVCIAGKPSQMKPCH